LPKPLLIAAAPELFRDTAGGKPLSPHVALVSGGATNNVQFLSVIVPAGATGRLNADGRCALNGTLTGSGNFIYYSPYVRSDMKGNWTAFPGQINLSTDADGSEMRVTNSFGFGTAALNIGAESYVYHSITNSSPRLDIGELTGDSTTGIGGGPTSGRTVTWQVGGRNTDATFDGGIFNSTGTTAITKTGTGTGIWTLTGASTHAGATTVSAGTLRVNGSTAGNNLIFQSAAALGGARAVTGNVTFKTGAELEHGALGAADLHRHSIKKSGFLVAGTRRFHARGHLHIATAETITMSLAQQAEASNLIWTGSTSSARDTATPNWTNGGSSLLFSNGSTVSFTEAGNATNPVSPAVDVGPESVFVDGSKNYTLTGTNQIVGDGTLTKAGSGTLTIATAPRRRDVGHGCINSHHSHRRHCQFHHHRRQRRHFHSLLDQCKGLRLMLFATISRQFAPANLSI
jgi:fibronectin-binding autotransporter adhesin